ncbi:MAG: flagellar motor protein MotD [Pseudomonadota bacterium]
MARKRKHEDHQNHEAWAIPYGDLITLLLAFFVVMYAISSVNEGKFRVLSDSLQAAFRGTPTSIDPVKVGDKPVRGNGGDIAATMSRNNDQSQMVEAVTVIKPVDPAAQITASKQISVIVPPELAKVADDVEASLASLVNAQLVTVKRHSFWIEVEIRTDILFPSGVATISQSARAALEALAKALAPYPNPIRVEGHTDNKPIKTVLFPSNWELSAARAASVVHLLADGGVAPKRLSVIGLGEWRPAKPNDSVDNRNANRRVLLVILSGTADATDGSAPMEMPDINSTEPAQQRAVPGESAAPVPASAAVGLPLPVTPSTN